MNAIGIDMSKDSFHAAFNEREVGIFPNTKEGIEMFLSSLEKKNITKKNAAIGVEATGVYHLLFCNQLKSQSWHVAVINPLESHRMIMSGLRSVKTDRHDAIAIRNMVLLGKGYPFLDTSEILALKALVSERQTLVRMRTTAKHQKHTQGIRRSAITVPFHDSFPELFAVLSKEIRILEKSMQTYAKETQCLLKSIPGIGKTTAAILVAFVSDVHRFATPEKLVAYIGMDPRVFQSGTSVQGKGYITKHGNTYLRHMLFNAAFVARRYNPALETYYKKKINEGKHYYSAMCAVERKLIHVIYAVWKRGTPFR
jgi:transposase